MSKIFVSSSSKSNSTSAAKSITLPATAIFVAVRSLSFEVNSFSFKSGTKESEIEFSKYNFEVADVEMLFADFNAKCDECLKTIEAGLPLPAYDLCMMASNTFNVLDARKAISQTERQNYMLKIRELSKGCAELYKAQEAERLERVKA